MTTNKIAAEDAEMVAASTISTSTEIGKPTTSIGPAKPPAVGSAGSTWIDSSSGTVHVSTGSAWTTVGGAVTGTLTSPSFAGGGIVATPSRVAKKPLAIIDGPVKRPKKLLVAFLGDDDEVEWCAKVNPDDIDVRFDKEEPAPRVELGFWLIDAG